MEIKKKNRIVGLIPARGGSKRVPKKNIRLLNNRPLITYTIEAAKKSKKIDRLIVSTDDSEIAEISRIAGAEVPFVRPAELARDESPDKPVYLHAIQWLEENENYFADIIVLLRPTTPFKTPQIIDKAIKYLEDTGADSVRTVNKVEGGDHPFWMFKKDDENRASPFIKGVTLEKYYRRQLLPPVYRLNSVVDIIKIEVLKNHLKIYGDDMRILEVSEEVALDIDTELDFEICETMMKNFKDIKHE